MSKAKIIEKIMFGRVEDNTFMEESLVNHPTHYGGEDNPYEVVKVAEAWGLDEDAYLFNVIKYIGRNGKKQGNPPVQDLEKAKWYLERRIINLKNEFK